MPTQKIFQVDAFSDHLFGGNPAAVCPLENWLEDELMQNIAAENNLAETAFFVKKGDQFELRWFTPTIEVDLCGHATLASAHIIFSNGYDKKEVVFYSPRSGELRVRKEEENYTLNFPADEMKPITPPETIIQALGVTPDQAFRGKTDYMIVVNHQAIIESLRPDFKLLSTMDGRGTIVTAPGDEVDFVSRCFFPQSGVDEDPVTGSAHTSMIPYWANRLGKTELSAIQLSKRKGHVNGKFLGNRVEISGKAVTYLTGEINY